MVLLVNSSSQGLILSGASQEPEYVETMYQSNTAKTKQTKSDSGINTLTHHIAQKYAWIKMTLLYGQILVKIYIFIFFAYVLIQKMK